MGKMFPEWSGTEAAGGLCVSIDRMYSEECGESMDACIDHSKSDEEKNATQIRQEDDCRAQKFAECEHHLDEVVAEQVKKAHSGEGNIHLETLPGFNETEWLHCETHPKCMTKLTHFCHHGSILPHWADHA